MKRYLLEITYRGDRFSGWQIQPNLTTVQGTIKDVLERITGSRISLKGASRTDTGVHAIQQYALAKGDISLPPDKLLKALNSNLPASIRIVKVKEVDEKFDPIKSANAKWYIYLIYKGAYLPPFLLNFASHLRTAENRDILMKCAKMVKGKHDFYSFMNRGSSVKNTVRKVFFSEWLFTERFLLYSVCADGFLKQMVRILVGTMLDVERGRLSLEDFQKLFELKNRRMAGKTAPPQGLYLYRIFYGENPLKVQKKHTQPLLAFLNTLEAIFP